MASAQNSLSEGTLKFALHIVLTLEHSTALIYGVQRSLPLSRQFSRSHDARSARVETKGILVTVRECKSCSGRILIGPL